MKEFPEHKKNPITRCFGPTNPKDDQGGTLPRLFYFCKPDHRKNARSDPKKTRWILTENQEYEVFRYADETLNVGHDGEMLGFYNSEGGSLEILGENDEMVAKFPKPQNVKDPWHGYPTRRYEFQVQDLDRWVASQVITETIKKRLLKGVL